MSIVLKPLYQVLIPGTKLTTTDKTGQWSVTANPGGFDPTGANNPKVTEATVGEIRIAKRTSAGLLETETTVNVYPTLPSDVDGTVDITSVAAGQGSAFADSVYRLSYVVQGIWVSNSDIPFLETSVKYIPIIPNACACWQRLSARAAKQVCNCGAVDEKLSKVSLYMRLLGEASVCPNVDAMQTNIDILTKLCAQNDCGCGCT